MCRAISALIVGLMLVTPGCGGGGKHVVSSHGVRVVVPSGWALVSPASPGPVTDPRTLLVVGTAGVHSKSAGCQSQIAAYRIPAAGAVVVVVGWTSVAAAGGVPKPGRGPLTKLVAVRRPSFECFDGRGAAASLLLGRKPYQVNVLVGNEATKEGVAEALAVARSFARNR